MQTQQYITPFTLSITGSDGTGGAGVQADIKTISALGGNAVTAITSVTVQNTAGITAVYDLPAEVVAGQVRAIMDDMHPRAVKVGLINDAATIAVVRQEIVGCPNIVCDPGILSSQGTKLMTDEAMQALCQSLLPVTSLLMLRCCEAELLLDMTIQTDEDMLSAAKQLAAMGAESVLLRGGQHVAGRLTALLYCQDHHEFFTSYNIEGWQRHGVGGALSSAIASQLAKGHDMRTAISLAHEYIHSQVVYSTNETTYMNRPADLYNQLLSLLAAHYTTAHDVAYYAQCLSITPRYLTRITDKIVGKSPKRVIDEYLASEAKVLLMGSRQSIQEIALRLGFTSGAAFARFFSKLTGQSPKEYREQQMVISAP